MSSALQSLRAKIKKRLGGNNRAFSASSDGDLFSNPLAIIAVILIAVGFILYGVYLYRNDTGRVRRGNTYYGHDIRSWTPLFTLDTEKIEPCIERCERDPACAGVTMDNDTLTCTGTKNSGLLRQDDPRYSAWVKPQKQQVSINDPTRWRVMGLVQGRTKLDHSQLPGLSSSGGHYNISMWVTLSDFYEGLGRWRHIMHLGSDPALTPLQQQSAQEWSAITAELPDQLPGLWIAPQSNNMRVAMTTIQRPDAAAAGARPAKRVEWIDIGNTPAPGRATHVSLNIYPEMVEVYVDGWLLQTMKLRGRPIVLSKPADMYLRAMPANGRVSGFAGYISDVLVVPKALQPGEIQTITQTTRPVST